MHLAQEGHCSYTPRFRFCDLKDVAELMNLVREIENEMGAIRVLVNNAANDDRHTLEEITPLSWDDRMAVNLRHQFFLIQSVSPGMREAGGGSIINMSSIAGLIPSTGLPPYVTAKAAVVGLTRTLAHRGPSNIRVNCVLPGAVLTDRLRRLWWSLEYEGQIMRNQALKRNLAPEDVARLVLFLVSDDSSAITNQSDVVDAGWV